MSGLFGGSHRAEALYRPANPDRLNALPIPIVWGVAGSRRMRSGTIISRRRQQQQGGGGKGGLFRGGPSTGYDYTAAIILALCEGPISGIGQIWRDQSTYTLAELGLSLFTGTTPQSVWSYLADRLSGAGARPTRAPPSSRAANYDLGDFGDDFQS